MDGLKLKYFVLNPSSSDKAYAKASRVAIKAFARAIRPGNPALADDLESWAGKPKASKNEIHYDFE
jgi:hypothetical protein